MSSAAGHRYVVGALIRRDFRALVDELELYATEHKGLFDSVFIVRGNDLARVQLARIMLDYAERQAAAEAAEAEAAKKRKWWGRG